MVAACTRLPVLGVPVLSRSLQGLDSLLSIVQMPGGIPVGTLAIGTAGAKNAGLLAARILALGDVALQNRMERFLQQQTMGVLEGAELSLPREEECE
jgi:5-(carboxyamino)imidazole ribonucleotide mutase